ncbi:hypothetical protein N657DRAFT_348542 [Parathielavia appendiculata]|uniref:Uncharacterized protein n=1 Tax=Parathielavia appendiculata TaxID=2587402 RepID=A0AAN6Z475_9PEZI|nr:hypothetical protein N657DRAFT_348542 [Parathielavia appendiculata]
MVGHILRWQCVATITRQFTHHTNSSWYGTVPWPWSLARLRPLQVPYRPIDIKRPLGLLITLFILGTVCFHATRHLKVRVAFRPIASSDPRFRRGIPHQSPPQGHDQDR